MKLIKQKAELLPWIPGIEGVYKMIELAGRTCYKSTDKITEDSAKPFVDRMINSKHTAMLEHGTVYFIMQYGGNRDESDRIEKYIKNKYTKYCQYINGKYYITTNLRVLVENDWLDDLQYLCEPTEFHEKRYTFRLVTSIGVTRELNRHRVNSIAEQSTRYCNYSKDKFGGEVSFVEPYWLELDKPINSDAYDNAYELFASACEEAEGYYMFLIDNGFTPQEAREVLPLCTASEIVHTAFASDWKHFFDLRYYGTTGAPHPNMRQLAELMKNELDKNGIKLD